MTFVTTLAKDNLNANFQEQNIFIKQKHRKIDTHLKKEELEL